MRKLFLIAALVLVSGSAFGQDATPAYRDVLRTCGAEWQARADKATNKGAEAWQTFRKDCVARKGFVSKRAAKANFVSVPDKAN